MTVASDSSKPHQISAGAPTMAPGLTDHIWTIKELLMTQSATFQLSFKGASNMADLKHFSTQIGALSDADGRILKGILDETVQKQADPHAFLFSVANAGLAALDIAYVKQRFRSFLSRIIDLSKQAQPPGWHASNGFFRDWVATDSILASMGGPPTIPLGPQAQPLFDVYLFWYNCVLVRVFRNANNVEGSRPGDAVIHAIEEIVKFAVDLFKAIFGDSGQAQQASQRLQRDFDAAVNRLNDASNQPVTGRHMNGWISVFSHDTAIFTLDVLNQKVPPGTPGDIGKLGNVIRAMLTALTGLQTQGHNPWLKGFWQLQYQATLEAAVIGLDAVPTLALRKQSDLPEDMGPLLQQVNAP